MDGIPIWVLLISTLVLIPGSSSESEDVRESLVEFIGKLSNGTFPQDPSWGWNSTSDPCTDKWRGVECDTKGLQVKKITLDDFNLTGSIDAESLCAAPGLSVLSMNRNMINGGLPEEIGDCRRLTHLYLSGNKLSGSVPEELSKLNNLKRFDISNNSFSGPLPELSRVSGLLSFLVEDNDFSGGIPSGFDFTNLEKFNVSNNNLSGPVPDVGSKFGTESFSGNGNLCGKPLSSSCPESPPISPPNTPPSSSPPPDKNRSRDQFLIYSGYMLLALVVISFIVAKLLIRNKHKNQQQQQNNSSPKVNSERRVRERTPEASNVKSSSSEAKTNGNSRSEMRSEYSITSGDSGVAAASFVLLSSPLVKGLKFNDLLRAPAELLGKGKHGSVYKVVLDNGVGIAVKRTKDWGISSEEFTRRVRKIDRVKHPRVLPPLALYCSDHEKLLVYEYQPNASLFMLLHGSQNGQVLDWGSRLVIASCVSEALAFMHSELNQDGIPHGNLKSTNILFNKDMEPCVSEYGLMVAETPDQHQPSFKIDVYAFGVLLLEMLTGKLVQNNGDDLAQWVHSVVREEWTVEVFERCLTSEGANEERMVNLLQVAMKCISVNPNERPNMNQVAAMVNAIREEEDRSVISEA